MTNFQTIEAFIAECAGEVSARRWIYEPGVSVYLRIGRRIVEGEPALSLEIANVEVDRMVRRQGKFKAVVQRAAVALLALPDCDRWCLFIENVQHRYLVPYLEREGWTLRASVGDPSPSYHVRPARLVNR
jgi:hypothetical protein